MPDIQTDASASIETDASEEMEKAPKSGGSPLGLIIAILAFLAGVAALFLAISNKPDLTPLETSIQTLEQSVQANTDNISAIMQNQAAMEEKTNAMIDEKINAYEAKKAEEQAAMEAQPAEGQ